MTSSMLSEYYSNWPSRQRNTQPTEVGAQDPTTYEELKATIELTLERTEWLSGSNKIAQDFLRMVRRIPGRGHNYSDPHAAFQTLRNVWHQVKAASLMSDMREFHHMKAQAEGGATGRTGVLTARQQELPSSIPGAGPPLPAWHSSIGSGPLPSRSMLRHDDSQQHWSSPGKMSPMPTNVGGAFGYVPAGTHPTGGKAALMRPRSGATANNEEGIRTFQPEAEIWEPLPNIQSPRPTPWYNEDLSAMITWISSMPFKTNGHFCDVFEGTHSLAGKVALKRPRIGTAGYNEDVIRRFQREAETWERLHHPHILEYLGTFRRDGHFYFVSPFIKNGTLVEYIAQYPNVNRVKLLCETADAISYLHKEQVVHGDIKASNLLIGGNGQILLCDFGLTRTTDLRTSTAMKGAGTLRWQSPELWEGGSKSFESDVYAFGMTIVEVLTGDVPFPSLQTDGAVIRAVLIEGKRPPKNPAVSSAGLSYDKVWAVAEACWLAIPEERISMREALQRIQEDRALTVI